MKKVLLISALLTSLSGLMYAQNNYDDIYYNPKKDKTQTQKGVTKKNSYYVPDFENVDVDAYNRRGESYYVTAIDTVGSGAASGEDFVYTRQIQKFYNPTIVVDNAELLADILDNSYGNVEVVYDGNLPLFVAPSRYNFWPYFTWTSYNFGNPWYWGPSFSWSWGPGWSWGPSWSWGWNYPSWGWGGYYPSSWGWDYPGWGWGWGGGWRPGHSQAWVNNHYRPNGNMTAGARPGWQSSSRPVVNNGSRPSTGVSRPTVGVGSYRPSYSTGNTTTGGYSNNNHRRPTTTTTTGTTSTSRRPSGTYTVPSSVSGKAGSFGTGSYNRYSGTTNTNSHRGTSTGTYRGGNTGSSSTTTTGHYNSNSGSGRNNSNSYNSGSGSSNRSSGGSYRSGGGSGAGRVGSGGGSRSGGGGGHRR